MNIKATALCLAAAAFAFTPKPAVAGDKEAAIVGGLIGGLIIGAAIADASDNDAHVVLAGHSYHRPDGYWRHVNVRTWVPGYWVTERRYGRVHRYYVDGHYEFRTRRVWVAHNHHRYDRYDRYDRHDRYDRYDRHDRYNRRDGRYGHDYRR